MLEIKIGQRYVTFANRFHLAPNNYTLWCKQNIEIVVDTKNYFIEVICIDCGGIFEYDKNSFIKHHKLVNKTIVI